MSDYIKNNFNADEHQCSITIMFLISIRLALNNCREKTTKADMHTIVEVFHEIECLRSENAMLKRKNEEVAMALDYLVEILC